MSYLEDELDLRILRYLVSGEGVHVNISAVSRAMRIHRSTAKKRVQGFFERGILNPPFYPFPQLFEEFPLLVIVKADMPRTEDARNFYRDDSHIFAAFSCMEGFYNTLLIEFFEDLENYHSWREQIVKEHKIPERGTRAPAHAEFFSNKLTFKYEPSCFIRGLRREFDEEGEVRLGDDILEDEEFHMFEDLMGGDFIRTNYSYIAREVGSNRKTVKRRIEDLLDEGLVDEPKCFFPNLFVPPGYNLVVVMVEVRSGAEEIKTYLKRDDHVARALETSTERYNFLIFAAFKSVEEFFRWGESLNSRYPEKIGAISKTILSSRMIHLIEPQKVSLGFIERKLWGVRR